MSETEKGHESPGIRVLIPPRIFALCVLSALVAETVFFDLSIDRVFNLNIWRLLVGILISSAGLAFMGWGFFRFSDHGTTVNTGKSASELVTSGAYGYSRNPMYVGFVVILLGPAVALATAPFLASALAMFLYLNFFVIQKEESYLRKRFGTAYQAYCGSVRRWL